MIERVDMIGFLDGLGEDGLTETLTDPSTGATFEVRGATRSAIRAGIKIDDMPHYREAYAAGLMVQTGIQGEQDV